MDSFALNQIKRKKEALESLRKRAKDTQDDWEKKVWDAESEYDNSIKEYLGDTFPFFVHEVIDYMEIDTQGTKEVFVVRGVIQSIDLSVDGKLVLITVQYTKDDKTTDKATVVYNSDGTTVEWVSGKQRELRECPPPPTTISPLGLLGKYYMK